MKLHLKPQEIEDIVEELVEVIVHDDNSVEATAEAIDNTVTLIKCINEHGYTAELEHLFGSELSQVGITSDSTTDEINTIMAAQLDVDNEALVEIIAGVILITGIVLIAIFNKDISPVIDNLIMVASDRAWKDIPAREFERSKPVTALQYSVASEYLDNALSIFSDVVDNSITAEGQFDIKKIDEWYKTAVKTAPGKIYLNTPKKLGWSTKNVLAFKDAALEIEVSADELNKKLKQFRKNIKQMGKLDPSVDKKQVKEYIKLLTAVLTAVARRFNMACDSFINVVESSEFCKNEFRYLKEIREKAEKENEKREAERKKREEDANK